MWGAGQGGGSDEKVLQLLPVVVLVDVVLDSIFLKV